MAALGAILGGVAGAGSSGMASAAQYQASKHERNVAWRRQQQWELIAPSLRVEGLRAAGLNPILAATQGMTGGPGHVQTAQTGGAPSFDTDIAGRAIASARQASVIKSVARKAEADAGTAENLEKATRYAPEKAYHDAGAAAQEWGRLAEETARLREATLNLAAERGLVGARQAQSEAEKRKLDVDRLLMELGVPGARAMEQLYEQYPALRQIREFGGGSLIGTAIGAGTAAGVGAHKYLGRQRGEIMRPMNKFGPKPPGSSYRRKTK